MSNKKVNLGNIQYSLTKILGIWVLVTVPMPVLAFIIAPALSPRLNIPPGIVTWLLMLGGMVWQFVVSGWIVYRELGTLRWSAIRERTWLKKPRDTKTGEPKVKLFWWLVPAFLYVFLIELGIGDFLNSAVASLFPFLSTLPSMDVGQIMVPEYIGAWWLVVSRASFDIYVGNCRFGMSFMELTKTSLDPYCPMREHFQK